MQVCPEYGKKEALLHETDYIGLVARYWDAGTICRYHIVCEGEVECIPDQPDGASIDVPTEFRDLEKDEIAVCSGFYANRPSMIIVYKRGDDERI
ncbi:MAG: hypothetical protein ACTSQY_05280 [Candidatus Odinarchaeia archaeon]